MPVVKDNNTIDANLLLAISETPDFRGSRIGLIDLFFAAHKSLLGRTALQIGIGIIEINEELLQTTKDSEIIGILEQEIEAIKNYSLDFS